MSGDESGEDDGGGVAFVEIAPEQLSEAVLQALVEEFITREGTDYGSTELSLEQKLARLMGQLAAGEARIVFEPESETTNIVLTRELPGA